MVVVAWILKADQDAFGRRLNYSLVIHCYRSAQGKTGQAWADPLLLVACDFERAFQLFLGLRHAVAIKTGAEFLPESLNLSGSQISCLSLVNGLAMRFKSLSCVSNLRTKRDEASPKKHPPALLAPCKRIFIKQLFFLFQEVPLQVQQEFPLVFGFLLGWMPGLLQSNFVFLSHCTLDAS